MRRIVHMLHLDIERLAELADSEPTSVEAAHLAVCEACRRERDAHRHLLVLASADRDRLAPPITSWESLSGRLREEGMLATGGAPVAPVERVADIVPRHHRGRGRMRWWMQAAAGVMLAAGGAVAGRMSVAASHETTPPVLADVTDSVVHVDEPAAPDLAPPRTSTGADVSVVDNKPGEPVFRPIATRAEAVKLLRQAQFDYQRAAAFLAQSDTATESPDVYRARLAAFEQSAATLESALADAPSDPVINAYYRATLQSRDITLQQLGSSVRLVRY
jgi:hypothetical protein